MSEGRCRKTIRLRRGPFLLASAALIVLVGAVGAVLVSRGGEEKGTGSANAPGCVLSKSDFGYPDWYLSQPVEYTAHPPLPVPGWREPTERVRFNVLFHSVFHGYVVLEYGVDVPPQKLAALRSWVGAHTRERVTSAPAAPDAPFAVDVAKWGHELRCTRIASLTVQKLDRFLALPRPSS